MKKIVKSKWLWIGLGIILLLLCVVDASIQIIGPSPEHLTVGERMMQSFSTIVERRNADGSITKYLLNGDPIFHGEYPYTYTTDITDSDLYRQEEWQYRVTYHYDEKEEDIFLFGDNWFIYDGKAYQLRYMQEFVQGIAGKFAWWDEVMVVDD